MTTRVIYGNRVFEHVHEWADDRPRLVVADYSRMLRAIARRLSQKGHWLAYPIETVAQDWDRDPAVNLARLTDILAHADELTEAQISRLEEAKRELERCLQKGQK